MGVTHHDERPVVRETPVWVAYVAVAVVVMLAVFALALWRAGTNSSDAKTSSDDAKRALVVAEKGNAAASCRSEFNAWVQEARDHVVNGQGTISQATYRGLKGSSIKDPVLFEQAVKLGDKSDAEIETWKRRLIARATTYRALTGLQRTHPAKADEQCSQGPPS